ncbi:MAG: pirin family protein [Steroidobacteraceae bacterium]|nr:pirin family protein [Steroidobacteraceae bacterium]
MIERRGFETLGGANHGWLDARHHFAFGEYHDPRRVQWGALRVWNDDTIQPGTGFPPHPHANMEIITFVREGAITHRDSLGNQGRTAAGDVQVMSAGAGIRHSEYNLDPGITRIFQIWILPDREGEPPCWGTKPFAQAGRSGRFVALASGSAGDGDALPIRANARVLGATLTAGTSAEYEFSDPTRHGYLVPATGRVDLHGIVLNAGDGAAITGETRIRITALADSELVLVDAAA